MNPGCNREMQLPAVRRRSVQDLADNHHALMSRMRRPDPKLPADRQDKRSVVAIELGDADAWLQGSIDDAAKLVRVP